MAYCSGISRLLIAHALGLHDHTILIWAGIPIALHWAASVVRWVITGTPVPRR